jgi:hypothetical protein
MGVYTHHALNSGQKDPRNQDILATMGFSRDINWTIHEVILEGFNVVDSGKEMY